MALPAEDPARTLRIAFENGRLPRELYAKNLLRTMGLDHHPTAQKVAAAFIVGKLDAHLLERNLKGLRSPPPPEDPDPIDAAPP